MTTPCSVEPPGFVSKTIGFGAPCPDCGHMDCHARYLRWEAERGIVRAQVERAPRPEWVIDTATHARLTLHGAVADVWQAITDDPTAWIWAVQDGDCYVRLHESMASAQIAAEDAMSDASEATLSVDTSGDIVPFPVDLPACSDPIMPDRWPPAGAAPWPPGTWRP